MTTISKKTTQVALEKPNFEIINRIGREVWDWFETRDDAEKELAMLFDGCLERCWCIHQQVLLKRGFPFAIRKVGNKGNVATKPMLKNWNEFLRIEEEFLDACYTARPNRKERVEALRQKYDKKYN